MSANPYYVNLEGDFSEEYEELVGPDGFRCVITEPEDRTFNRDLRGMVDRLNSQATTINALRSRVAGLERALDQVVPDWLPVGAKDASEAIARCSMEFAIRLIRARQALAEGRPL